MNKTAFKRISARASVFALCGGFPMAKIVSMKKIAILCLLLFVSSCMNPYEESFRASTLDTSPISEYAHVQVIHTNAIDVALKKYQAEGYEVIGNSDFDGSRSWNEEEKIKKAARKVGATLVVYGKFFSRISSDYNSYSRQTFYHKIYKKEAYFLRKKDIPESVESKVPKPKKSNKKHKTKNPPLN